MKKFWLTLILLPMLLLAAGCTTTPAPWSRYELCFGRSADAGQTRISEPQWQQFRDAEIASRFPDGFTVYHANGFWRSGAETYTEPSEILMVVAPDCRDTDAKLAAIAQAYVRQFHQEAVLRIKSPATVDFLRAAEPPVGDAGPRNGVPAK